MENILEKIITINKNVKIELENGEEKDFVTSYKVDLPSINQNNIEQVKQTKKVKSATDFVWANYGINYSKFKASNGKLAIPYFLNNEVKTRNYVLGLAVDGTTYECIYSNDCLGIVPKLTLKLPLSDENFKTKKTVYENGDEKHLFEFGIYPKNCVDKKTNETLEKLYKQQNFNELLPTGLWYSTNGLINGLTGYASMLNPEFVFNNKKFVRAIVRKNVSNVKYSSGEPVQSTGDVQWFQVEPISFEILNWSQMPKYINPQGDGTATTLQAETDEAIVSGIPFLASEFLPQISYYQLWENSVIKAFLNSEKTSETIANSQFDIITDWDFKQKGLLYEAFNLKRTPIKVYVIPKCENEICMSAFEGCVTIEKIIVPNHIKQIGDRAFAGLNLKTQVVFETGLNNVILSENTFDDTNFKFIYITKNGKYVILSNFEDKQLQKLSFCENFNLKTFEKLIEPNYRNNYIKLHKWYNEKTIKFIPPDFICETFPFDKIENFFINKNNNKWGQLVKNLKFDTLEGIEKQNALTDLLKIYYAIGGFSDVESNRDKAFKFIVENVATNKNDNLSVQDIANDIHRRFSRIELKGDFNPVFAQFFMKYYGKNPNFMCFNFENDSNTESVKDYLCMAHNRFENILKAFPNRTVNGTEQRSLLSPEFVAKHSIHTDYKNIKQGNKLLAEIVGQYGYTQKQFEIIQDVFERAKHIKNSYVIKADNSAQSKESLISFRFLEKDDPLGFVLGDITNCCQVVGGTAQSCVFDGYTNPNAGFLIFETSLLDKNGNPTNEKTILGQAYIWYDPQTKTVCYDNIEIPKKIGQMLKLAEKNNSEFSYEDFLKAVEASANSVMKVMNKKELQVKQVTTGQAYNSLNDVLLAKFGKPNTTELAKHQGYLGYSDAKEGQFIIKKYCDETQKFEDDIMSVVQEIKSDIETMENVTLNSRTM